MRGFYAVCTNSVFKNFIFWDIMLCVPLKVTRRFRESAAFNFGNAKYPGFFLDLTISPLRSWRRVPPKRRLTSNALRCVVSQKTDLFITTAVRISPHIDPTVQLRKRSRVSKQLAPRVVLVAYPEPIAELIPPNTATSHNVAQCMWKCSFPISFHLTHFQLRFKGNARYSGIHSFATLVCLT
jgi:hypothetical protein